MKAIRSKLDYWIELGNMKGMLDMNVLWESVYIFLY